MNAAAIAISSRSNPSNSPEKSCQFSESRAVRLCSQIDIYYYSTWLRDHTFISPLLLSLKLGLMKQT